MVWLRNTKNSFPLHTLIDKEIIFKDALLSGDLQIYYTHGIQSIRGYIVFAFSVSMLVCLSVC